MVQTCQVNWTITIPKNTLAIQLNRVSEAPVGGVPTANAAVNFNGVADPIIPTVTNMLQTTQLYSSFETLRFWIGFSTACGPFNQFAICKDNTKLWDTSIYAREQAVICSNSLSDLCTNNSVSVSPLESIIAGKRHCGWRIRFELIEPDIQFFSCVDQKLRIIIFIALDVGLPARFEGQKPDIVYLLASPVETVYSYRKFSVRLVNMSGATAGATEPQKTISQIHNAVFNKLEIQNVCFNVENEEAIVELIRNQRLINFPTQVLRTQSTNYPFGGFKTGNSLQSIMSFSNIKSIFMTFAMPQYPTWFFPVLFKGFDLIIDQRHVIPTPYEAL
ncbi:MAG: hypothetical protein EZS28_048290, partial [Streblomastix strix]